MSPSQCLKRVNKAIRELEEIDPVTQTGMRAQNVIIHDVLFILKDFFALEVYNVKQRKKARDQQRLSNWKERKGAKNANISGAGNGTPD